MANDIVKTTQRCTACAEISGTVVLPQGILKLFPAAGTSELVAINILRPFDKSTHRHRIVLVITDRFSKMTGANSLQLVPAIDVAMAFLVHWIYTYGLPRYLLTNNGLQFLAKLVDHVCSALGLEHLLTTAYHPHTTGEVDHFDRTLASR